MQDLNDLFFFAQVVEHGGFAAAGRALGIPKSKLSRRVSMLEERLGVRLIQRSTRRFSVTELGQAYHRHCLAMAAEAEAAQETIDRSRAEPQGLIRVTCPVSLVSDRVAPIVARFMADHPRLRVHLEASNRRVDVIEEGVDVAIRVRMPPLEDSDLVIRQLKRHDSALIASPRLLGQGERPRHPDDLARFDSLDMANATGVHVWRLQDPQGRPCAVTHRPRLVTDDLGMVRQAALCGVGVAILPRFMIADDLARGDLEALLPGWTQPSGIVHAVFPSRRGLLPSVRLFIDRLVEDFGAVESSPAATQATAITG
jgi:DNA-binding transcriptional LysR family regulator